MNWKCDVCGNGFELNPRPTKTDSPVTVTAAGKQYWLCPVHGERVLDLIDNMKAGELTHAEKG